MDTVSDAVLSIHQLEARAGPSSEGRPPVYKGVGIALAIASGVFIGTSFVLKKSGLLKANVKYNEEAGEGYGYLKNAFWWTGMILMIVGEICNFVAYAFVDAILVTPLGALSVVITTILSAIFLKERLSFVGKVGCFICIIGSIVIAVNAPEQSSVTDIEDMKHYVIAPGFLSYAGVVLVGCAFTAIWAGPRYGKKSMLVYLTICSLIGGLSVVATQGLGAAILAQIGGKPQFNQWFLYVLLVFVVGTLLTEIIYLNKALNIFNAALVTPTYYVYFTSATIVSSAILFQGFKGSPAAIVTVVMGFLQICSGVVLLQLSKSAKDVPDAAIFSGDLDQVRTVAEQEQPESEPKADTIRGTAALIRRISVSRQKWEAEEAKRIHEERMRDLEPLQEGEQFEWDGIRRRRTTVGSRSVGSRGGGIERKKTVHPPLGMTHFPSEEEQEEERRRSRSDSTGEENHREGLLGGIRDRARSILSHRGPSEPRSPNSQTGTHPVALTEIGHSRGRLGEDTSYKSERSGSGSARGGTPIRWVDDLESPGQRSRENLTPGEEGSAPALRPPPNSAKRQFSFQNVFQRHHSSAKDNYSQTTPHQSVSKLDTIRQGLGSRQSTTSNKQKGATEEERLGLVKGDSTAEVDRLPDYTSDDDDDDEKEWGAEGKRRMTPSSSGSSLHDTGEKEVEAYMERRGWKDSSKEQSREHSRSGSERVSPATGLPGAKVRQPPPGYRYDSGQGSNGGSKGSGPPAFI